MKIITGKTWKEDKFWLAEIPLLDLMTQAKKKKEIPEMVKDLVELFVDDPNFSVQVSMNGDELCIIANDYEKLNLLALKRKRQD